MEAVDGDVLAIGAGLLSLLAILCCRGRCCRPADRRRRNFVARPGRRFNADCALCLEDPVPLGRRAVLNCGHLFCAACLAHPRLAGGDGGARCPICRRRVNLIFLDRPCTADAEDAARIRAFNARHELMRRPWADILLDLPAAFREVARHGHRALFTPAQLALAAVAATAAAVYVLSPVDCIPEAGLGLIGLVDDVALIAAAIVAAAEAIRGAARV